MGQSQNFVLCSVNIGQVWHSCKLETAKGQRWRDPKRGSTPTRSGGLLDWRNATRRVFALQLVLAACKIHVNGYRTGLISKLQW